MARNDELADQAATLLITADLWFFRDFILEPHLTPIRGLAALALMPFLSAFVFESAEYLKRIDSDMDLVSRPHRELLRASRQRLKHLDDSKRSFAASNIDLYLRIASRVRQSGLRRGVTRIHWHAQRADAEQQVTP
jgi:hypothetical protein